MARRREPPRRFFTRRNARSSPAPWPQARDAPADLVAHIAERAELLAPLDSARIGQWPVHAAHVAGKRGTGLRGLAAQRHHRVALGPRHLAQVFRALLDEVDPGFLHDLDRARVNAG